MMMMTFLRLLPLALLVAGAELPRWELSVESPVAGQAFVARAPLSSSNVSWRISSDCETVAKNGAEATFACLLPGRHALYAADSAGQEASVLCRRSRCVVIPLTTRCGVPLAGDCIARDGCAALLLLRVASLRRGRVRPCLERRA